MLMKEYGLFQICPKKCIHSDLLLKSATSLEIIVMFDPWENCEWIYGGNYLLPYVIIICNLNLFKQLVFLVTFLDDFFNPLK